jgi:phosphatidylglycerol:prolipoprotein diacylglycerol transferase
MESFWHWWQHLPSRMDPVLISVGPLKIQYYGLMYLLAFGCAYGLARMRVKTEKRFAISIDDLQSAFTAMILGLVIGARLGYVLFYAMGYFLNHPLEIFLPFTFSDGFRFTGISGMSYHGGLIGVVIAGWLFCRQRAFPLKDLADLVAPGVPLGYTFGRIGNFINGELYGRVTDLPVGMMFPLAPDQGLRHPSQLYEAVGEGILLFLVLWNLRKIALPRGAMLALYLMGYGLVRFFIEFARQPDAHMGFVIGPFSMGQLLCSLMIAGGIAIGLLLRRADRVAPKNPWR